MYKVRVDSVNFRCAKKPKRKLGTAGKDIRHIVYISLSLHKMSDLYISQFSLCKSLLSRMAQKLGPHIVQYSPSVTALSL